MLCVAVRARADWLANRLLTPQHTALPFPQGYTAKVALRVASPGRASISAVRGLLRMQNQVTASVKRDDPAQTQTQRQMQTQSSSGSTDGAGGAGTPASGEQQRPKREGQSQRTQQGHEVVSISAPSTERADALFAEVQQVGGASGGTVTMEAVEAWSGPDGPISKAFRLRHGGGGGSGGSPTRGGLDLRSAMRQACHAAAAGSGGNSGGANAVGGCSPESGLRGLFSIESDREWRRLRRPPPPPPTSPSPLAVARKIDPSPAAVAAAIPARTAAARQRRNAASLQPKHHRRTETRILALNAAGPST